MICPNCGFDNLDENNFCAKCGVGLNNNNYEFDDVYSDSSMSPNQDEYQEDYIDDQQTFNDDYFNDDQYDNAQYDDQYVDDYDQPYDDYYDEEYNEPYVENNDDTTSNGKQKNNKGLIIALVVIAIMLFASATAAFLIFDPLDIVPYDFTKEVSQTSGENKNKAEESKAKSVTSSSNQADSSSSSTSQNSSTSEPSSNAITPPDAEVSEKTYVVNTSQGLILRSSPDKNSNRVLPNALRLGTKLSVVGKSNSTSDWVYVFVKNSNAYGWVNAAYIVAESEYTTKAEIKIVQPDKNYDGPVYASVSPSAGLNLRSGPSTQYDKITIIPQNAKVECIGTKSGSNWIYVKYSNQYGWVSNDYLKYD